MEMIDWWGCFGGPIVPGENVICVSWGALALQVGILVGVAIFILLSLLFFKESSSAKQVKNKTEVVK
jgi:hypothetical protein